jgi:hypothetical protein
LAACQATCAPKPWRASRRPGGAIPAWKLPAPALIDKQRIKFCFPGVVRQRGASLSSRRSTPLSTPPRPRTPATALVCARWASVSRGAASLWPCATLSIWLCRPGAAGHA